eukprot:9483900-Pyramimonas_sp.AAC.1
MCILGPLPICPCYQPPRIQRCLPSSSSSSSSDSSSSDSSSFSGSSSSSRAPPPPHAAHHSPRSPQFNSCMLWLLVWLAPGTPAPTPAGTRVDEHGASGAAQGIIAGRV